MPKFNPIPLLQRAFAPDGWLAKLWPLWSLFLVCLLVVLFLNPAKAGGGRVTEVYPTIYICQSLTARLYRRVLSRPARGR